MASSEDMMANMSAEDEAMMAAWDEFMTPGTQHLGLAATAGRWKLHLTHWMRPGVPAEESDAVATLESFADGRYLIERVEGDTPMGTGSMRSEGDGDANARMIRYSGTFDDPMNGGESNVRSERQVLSDDSFIFKMWMEMDGQEFKTMEILYTRA